MWLTVCAKCRCESTDGCCHTFKRQRIKCNRNPLFYTILTVMFELDCCNETSCRVDVAIRNSEKPSVKKPWI
nr:hypothetical protein [Tanacetum cinerariifolium]